MQQYGKMLFAGEDSFLYRDLLPLSVLLPLIFGVLTVFVRSRIMASKIYAASCVIYSFVSVVMLCCCSDNLRYLYGGWSEYIGIAFRYTHFAGYLFFAFSLISLSYATYGVCLCDDISLCVGDDTSNNASTKSVIFYSLLHFFYAGVVGIIFSNDIFNIYVFLEIMSISSYVLASVGYEKSSVRGALVYLIYGTVASVLILCGIGLLFQFTGSLNISYILSIVYSDYVLELMLAVFLIGGVLLKLGIFPLYIWQRETYVHSHPYVCGILACGGTVAALAMACKFMLFTFNNSGVHSSISTFLNVMACISMMYAVVRLLSQNTYRKSLIYISLSHAGAYVLLIVNGSRIDHEYLKLLLTALVLYDMVLKAAAYILIANRDAKYTDVPLDAFHGLYHRDFKGAVVVTLLIMQILGLPFGAIFLNKLNMLHYFMSNSMYYVVYSMLLASFGVMMYFVRCVYYIFRKDNKVGDKFYMSRSGYWYVMSSVVMVLIPIFYP